eukprot:TRINITY_DN8662_c0_g1_i1.p1 TRINITY_DN8662_c0_g1~~TRINITY_DN8662_c0_g1_i1.p1  ORF type:complete len:413 (+),score=32.74 TRINITY_DN8662_c0_g1_i1:55-1239(+)
MPLRLDLGSGIARGMKRWTRLWWRFYFIWVCVLPFSSLWALLWAILNPYFYPGSAWQSNVCGWLPWLFVAACGMKHANSIGWVSLTISVGFFAFLTLLTSFILTCARYDEILVCITAKFLRSSLMCTWNSLYYILPSDHWRRLQKNVQFSVSVTFKPLPTFSLRYTHRHALEANSYSRLLCFCEDCGRRFGTHHRRSTERYCNSYSCRDCDFDLCEGCFSKIQPSAHAHPLELFESVRRWKCDACGRRDRRTGPQYRCTEDCDYDLCGVCSARLPQEQANEKDAFTQPCNDSIVERTNENDAFTQPCNDSIVERTNENDAFTQPCNDCIVDSSDAQPSSIVVETNAPLPTNERIDDEVSVNSYRANVNETNEAQQPVTGVQVSIIGASKSHFAP